MNKIIQWAIAGAMGMALTGCASLGEPSGGEILSAIETTVLQNDEQMRQMGRDDPQIEPLANAFRLKVHGVNKIGCKAESQQSWLCSVRVDMESGITGRAQNTVPLRLVRGDTGWVMSTGA